MTIEGVDVDKHIEQGLTEEEVVQLCVNFLNKPIGKRKKRQPYGNLEILRTPIPSWQEGDYDNRFTIREEDGDKYITLLATVDQKKNKHFWGKGQSVMKTKRRKR